MIKYAEYLKLILENKKIFEFSIDKYEFIKSDRFKNSNDFKDLIKLLNNDINIIKNKLKNVHFDEIEFLNKKDYLIVQYNSEIYSLLKLFEIQIFNFKNNDEVLSKIFQNDYSDLFLEICLTGEFNILDILNGLPIFMRNLGIGKKIYKKLIKDYNYISSFNGNNPSIDSSITWNSIIDDSDIFSFINDDNIISFWKDYDYNKIINKLSNFYKYDGIKIFDNDFKIKYNLNDDILKLII